MRPPATTTTGTSRDVAVQQSAEEGAVQLAGVVVALCAGHRCAALNRTCGNGGPATDPVIDPAGDLAAAVARSRGGVLISASCLQQCAEGAVAAVAIRSSGADITGPSIWLGGLDNNGHLHTLGRWVEQWKPATGQVTALPEGLRSAMIGSGPSVRLTPARH